MTTLKGFKSECACTSNIQIYAGYNHEPVIDHFTTPSQTIQKVRQTFLQKRSTESDTNWCFETYTQCIHTLFRLQWCVHSSHSYYKVYETVLYRCATMLSKPRPFLCANHRLEERVDCHIITKCVRSDKQRHESAAHQKRQIAGQVSEIVVKLNRTARKHSRKNCRAAQ